jgi:hypothetical protein
MIDWLDLDKHRRKLRPQEVDNSIIENTWNAKGPWYSDEGEDGVLAYIFNNIVYSNGDLYEQHKFAVDLGSAHGYGGSNVRHLVDKYGWDSCEIDVSKKWGKIHPRVINKFIDRDTICDTLTENGTPKNFDLLSLDIDSMDWYVLERLLEGGWKPTLTILEFNPIFKHDESYIVKYNRDFKKNNTSNYGASARAFEILLNKYNYSFVWGTQLPANNIVFVSNNIIGDSPTLHLKDFHSKPWYESGKIHGEVDIKKRRKELMEVDFEKYK